MTEAVAFVTSEAGGVLAVIVSTGIKRANLRERLPEELLHDAQPLTFCYLLTPTRPALAAELFHLPGVKIGFCHRGGEFLPLRSALRGSGAGAGIC